MTPEHAWPPQSPVHVGLRGLCPRCGRGKLFRGPLSLALKPACEQCGLDTAFIDTGDGPAVFVTLIAGFIVLALALYVEFTFEPPLIVHIVLWPIVALIVCLPLLKWMKGLLIALQYVNKAEEARLE